MACRFFLVPALEAALMGSGGPWSILRAAVTIDRPALTIDRPPAVHGRVSTGGRLSSFGVHGSVLHGVAGGSFYAMYHGSRPC